MGQNNDSVKEQFNQLYFVDDFNLASQLNQRVDTFTSEVNVDFGTSPNEAHDVLDNNDMLQEGVNDTSRNEAQEDDPNVMNDDALREGVNDTSVATRPVRDRKLSSKLADFEYELPRSIQSAHLSTSSVYNEELYSPDYIYSFFSQCLEGV